MALIGFSLDVTHTDPLKKAQIAAENGIDILELKLDNPILDPEKITSETEKKLKEIVENYNLKVTVHAPYIGVNLAGPGEWLIEASKKRLQQAIDFAEQWEAIYVLVHGGRIPRDMQKWQESIPELTNKFVTNIQELTDYAKEKGLVLTLENTTPYNGYNIVDSLDKFTDILHRVDVLKAVIDVGHLNLTSDIYELNKITNNALFNERLAGFHIHNNNKKYDQHVGIDKGLIDFNKLQPVFEQFYDRVFICELDDIKEVLKFKEYIFNFRPKSEN